MTKTDTVFRLPDSFVATYGEKQPPFGFNGLGELVYLRTYSRLKEDGTQERWHETVRRVVEGCFTMQKRHIEEHHLGWSERKAQRSAKIMYDLMFNMKFLPPGRGLWAMGSPLTMEKNLHAALFNCAFVSTENLDKDLAEPFTFLMDASMLGIGVGFDTKGAGKLTIRTPAGEPVTYVIPDTREGWVESLKLLLESYFVAHSKPVVFDYSQIRPAGEPIKGFGGVASGPDPLLRLHDDIRRVLDASVGKPISVTNIVDIQNLIGRCVIAGNIRRTAEIAFGEPNDEEFIDLKNYEKNPERAEYGWTSNNSIYAELGMDYAPTAKRVALNGEPGYAWLENMRAFGRMGDPANYADRRVSGTNPCKPLNSLILTPNGYISFADALEREYLQVVLADGSVTTATKPFLTGVQRNVWRVRMSNGIDLYGTENHQHRLASGEWKRMDELNIGDALDVVYPPVYRAVVEDEAEYNEGVLHGWLWADGCVYKRKDSDSYRATLAVGVNEFECTQMLEAIVGKSAVDHHQKPDTCKNIRVPLAMVDEEFDKEDLAWLRSKSGSYKLGFIRAAFTCDGSVRGDGTVVELYATRRDALVVMHTLLAEFGVKSGVTTHNHARTYTAKDGKVRNNATTYKLTVYGGGFNKIGFLSEHKNNKLKEAPVGSRNRIFVTDIDPQWSVEDVYDITVHDESHAFLDVGVVTHNCVEQSLESYETCNLVETFPANHSSLEEYKLTLKYSYLFGKTVTLSKTPWMKTNRIALRNRRIGLSMSGIQQAIAKFGIEEFRRWCDEGYKTVKHYDEIYSEWLAIPKSVKVTSIKPSGSVSLLAGATPGMHWPENRVYIRRMRLAEHSDLLQPIKDAGYKVEQDAYSPQTLVVEIPVKIEEDIRTAAEVSMWEQLAMAAFLQRYWADNQVSATITFNPATEGAQIASSLDYYQYQLKGISFLPRHDYGAYAQMPYEAISEERYHELVAGLKPLVFGNTHEEAEQEKYCGNDGCMII